MRSKRKRAEASARPLSGSNVLRWREGELFVIRRWLLLTSKRQLRPGLPLSNVGPQKAGPASVEKGMLNAS